MYNKKKHAFNLNLYQPWFDRLVFRSMDDSQGPSPLVSGFWSSHRPFCCWRPQSVSERVEWSSKRPFQEVLGTSRNFLWKMRQDDSVHVSRGELGVTGSSPWSDIQVNGRMYIGPVLVPYMTQSISGLDISEGLMSDPWETVSFEILLLSFSRAACDELLGFVWWTCLVGGNQIPCHWEWLLPV